VHHQKCYSTSSFCPNVNLIYNTLHIFRQQTPCKLNAPFQGNPRVHLSVLVFHLISQLLVRMKLSDKVICNLYSFKLSIKETEYLPEQVITDTNCETFVSLVLLTGFLFHYHCFYFCTRDLCKVICSCSFLYYLFPFIISCIIYIFT